MMDQNFSDNAADKLTGDKSSPSETDQYGRKLYQITCSQCGQPALVPFKPAESRPVYCQECYKQHRPVKRFNRMDRGKRRLR